MILIGNFLSPYVRRVAVSLNHLGLAFELESVRVFDDPAAVRAHNPVTRIPTLLLDDGTALVESYAILDEIDRLVGPDRALVPATGAARREVMQVTALALAATEKAQWALYEGRFHPPEKVHQPWIDHNDDQAAAGFAALDRLASGGWLAGTDAISQADITAVCGFSFAAMVRPALDLAETAPNLAGLAERCEAMEIFAAAQIPAWSQ